MKKKSSLIILALCFLICLVALFSIEPTEEASSSNVLLVLSLYGVVLFLVVFVVRIYE